MQKSIADQLVKFCEAATHLGSSFGLVNWSSQVHSFLRTAIGPDAADEFYSLRHDDEWTENALRLGHLQGLIAKAVAQHSESTIIVQPPNMSHSVVPGSRKVFVVHGHDDDAKEKTARFLERLGLEPIILHEQPSSGRTIIEKFETYSGDVAFAVILLTPDDVGGTMPTDLNPRARQNVVLELGYFIGRLGRSRVCALHKGQTELPSDYQGVLYIDFDAPGAWKAKLAQELVQAKLPIELSGLLGG